MERRMRRQTLLRFLFPALAIACQFISAVPANAEDFAEDFSGIRSCPRPPPGTVTGSSDGRADRARDVIRTCRDSAP